MSFRQEFEKHYYIIKKLGTGTYGEVYAAISKPIADELISDFKRSSEPERATTAKVQLRQRIQAGKISKGGRSFRGKNDCRVEIEAMRSLSAGNHPNIVRLTTADSSYGWLTLEPLAGGDLLNFPMHAHGYAHMDFAERNIMLRPSGAYKDYPDLVVIDLGQAYSYDALSRDWKRYARRDTKQLVELQVKDLAAVHFPLTASFSRLVRVNVRLSDALKKVKEYCALKGERADEHYTHFLTQLRDDSLKWREQSYEVLPHEYAAYFETQNVIVSDGELEKAFPDLA